MFRHELAKFTQRMVMFSHQVKVMRESPIPYVYITKKLWREMGEPQVIEISVRPVLPQGEMDRPMKYEEMIRQRDYLIQQLRIADLHDDLDYMVSCKIELDDLQVAIDSEEE